MVSYIVAENLKNFELVKQAIIVKEVNHCYDLNIRMMLTAGTEPSYLILE